ncbi:MAG: DUF2161 family putative PD-(D/E)XK-type phosphodiesterase [Spirochaetia bacterium]
MKLKETDLYEPIKIYLEAQGYQVNAEVSGCDVTAVNGEEMIIIEMKTRVSLRLLIQAVERLEINDSVYIAVPLQGSKSFPPNYKGLRKLLQRLGIGLLFVRFYKGKTKVEAALHPKDYFPRKNKRKRETIIREIRGRYKDFNTGGSATEKERVTLYKQRAIQIAVYLDVIGTASPKVLRDSGTDKNTQQILNNNFYGWFVKEKRGIYSLHPQGKKALSSYPELVQYFRNLFPDR